MKTLFALAQLFRRCKIKIIHKNNGYILVVQPHLLYSVTLIYVTLPLILRLPFPFKIGCLLCVLFCSHRNQHTLKVSVNCHWVILTSLFIRFMCLCGIDMCLYIFPGWWRFYLSVFRGPGSAWVWVTSTSCNGRNITGMEHYGRKWTSFRKFEFYYCCLEPNIYIPHIWCELSPIRPEVHGFYIGCSSRDSNFKKNAC